MLGHYSSTAVIVSMLIATSYGSCGIHQMLDVVVLYDVSSNITTADFEDEKSFIDRLGLELYLHPDHTNIAGIGVDDSAHFGWGLRDYMNTHNLMTGLTNVNHTGGGSDLSPGMDMAWNNILSSNARSGSTRWLLVVTSTTVMSSTTSLDAMKAAGVKPLTINNLPTEVELGDDVSSETLLIVINATDPAADSISCMLASILPETTNFRLDDYLNGTAGVFLNADAELDFKTTEEYKIFVTCTGTSSMESFLTIRILDKSVTTPYTVPAWAAGAIVVSVGSVGVVLAMVCFLIVVILATTDEAEVLPPVEEDENAKKPVDDAAQMYKKVDKKETYREGFGEF